MKDDVCMNLCNKKLLCWETGVSGVGLVAGLLQTRDCLQLLQGEAPDNRELHPIAFASKCLANGDTRHSNIEREVLGILQYLEKFHQYCLVLAVSMIIDHKPLVAVF